MGPKLMTVEELARYLQLNEQTVYRKSKRGEIPAIQIGRTLRFKQEAIDRWLGEKGRQSYDREL